VTACAPFWHAWPASVGLLALRMWPPGTYSFQLFSHTLLTQIHRPDYAEKLAAYKQKVEEMVANMQTKGLVFLIIHHLLEGFKDKLRRNHDWLGVLLPTLDTQVR